jgi:hypothetical protein
VSTVPFRLGGSRWAGQVPSLFDAGKLLIRQFAITTFMKACAGLLTICMPRELDASDIDRHLADNGTPLQVVSDICKLQRLLHC